MLHYRALRFAEIQTTAFLLHTLRVEERDMPLGLAEWRTAIERAVPLTRLQLGPLALEDIVRLLQALGAFRCRYLGEDISRMGVGLSPPKVPGTTMRALACPRPYDNQIPTPERALGGGTDGDGRRTADLERFGRWLFAETEGQPFYLIETLKVLLERDVLASRPNEGGGWTIGFTAVMENGLVVRGFFPPSGRVVIC